MRENKDFSSNLSEFFAFFLYNVPSLLFLKRSRDIKTTPCLIILGSR